MLKAKTIRKEFITSQTFISITVFSVFVDLIKLKYKLRVCLECGKTFYPISNRQVFCSVKCRGRHDSRKFRARGKKKYEPRYCAECGEVFAPKNINQSFCSKACGNKYFKRKWYYKHREHILRILRIKRKGICFSELIEEARKIGAESFFLHSQIPKRGMGLGTFINIHITKINGQLRVKEAALLENWRKKRGFNELDILFYGLY